MVFSNKLPQSLFLLLLIVFSFSCSKEDEEVGRPDYTTTTFELRYNRIASNYKGITKQTLPTLKEKEN